MNSNLGKQKLFIVYQIINLIDGKIYIGAHCTYNINDKYMGSSKYLKKDIKEFGRQNFKKIPLHVFDNKEDMMKKEAEIVTKEFCHRQDTYNIITGGIHTSFNFEGMIKCKDKNGKFYLVYKDDPRWLSKELVGMNKGIVTVKDKKGNHFNVEKNDERYLSGELLFVAKGLPSAMGMLGKKQTSEAKEKVRQARLGKKASNETLEKLKLRKTTNEMREKMRNTRIGTCMINNGTENKLIKKEVLDKWTNQGWIIGKIKMNG